MKNFSFSSSNFCVFLLFLFFYSGDSTASVTSVTVVVGYDEGAAIGTIRLFDPIVEVQIQKRGV